MCGIAGKVYFDGQQPVDPRLIQEMIDIIAHRGPDGEGKFVSGPVGLGHRRLSIIDLNTGDQPMSNEDDTVWVVYNGEIYNFPELRAKLQARGHKFKSAADTEVIVHLYEDLGEYCVGQFRGMFAFAIWDERRQVLLLARDRVGIKPLYFANTGEALIFGSEIKSLLVDPSIHRRINLLAIDRFLTYSYLPGNETLFDGIHKLEAGHYLIVESGHVAKRQYWDLHFETLTSWRSFEDAVSALKVLLRSTVRDHMISDVPVGVLLSGGVDSTGVLRYAVEQTDKPIHTFTMGFDGAEFADERPYARLAVEKYGTRHHEMTMTSNDFTDFLPKYVWHMEEPVCEPPAVALYFISHLARQSSVKVLLSGEGGDEAFGGYQNYRNLIALEKLKLALGPAKGLLRSGFRALERCGWKRIGRYGHLVDPALDQYYLSRTATPYTSFNRMKDALYTKDFAEAIASQSPSSLTGQLFEKMIGQPFLNRMLYVDSKTWLPDDLLVKADKMTMATSVELRVPLLDFQVLEFAASLPETYKVRGWMLKRILKAALRDSVPREILNRKKTGFPVPYDNWLRHEMKEFVFDTLSGKNVAIGSYFNQSKINYFLEAHQRGEDYSKEVFSLAVLELWHKVFLERNTNYA